MVVFSFQANIYCAILSAFFKFSLISRSNSSPSGWDQNFFKKKIFSYFFKYVNFIIVNSYEFQKELFKKYKLKSKAATELTPILSPKEESERLKFTVLLL